MYCPSCGFESNQKTNFCKRCGAPTGSTGNSIEIHLPKQPILGMVLFTVVFTIIGLITVLTGFSELAHRSLPGGGLIVALLGSLVFLFGISGLLIWQIARMISTYQEAIRQTVQKAQFESIAPPQAPPMYIPAPQEPIPSSVTEHTTRQMAGKSRVSQS